MLREARDPDVRGVLLRIEAGKLEQLRSQLAEFVDTHDYRRTAGGFAEEKDSWLRAVELVSGVKDAF